MPKTTTAYPAQINVRGPKSWPAKIRDIARRRETSVGEWLRGVIRAAIESENRYDFERNGGRRGPDGHEIGPTDR